MTCFIKLLIENNGGDEGIRTPDTGFARITV